MLNESITAGTTGHHQRARDYCIVKLFTEKQTNPRYWYENLISLNYCIVVLIISSATVLIISASVVLYYTYLQQPI